VKYHIDIEVGPRRRRTVCDLYSNLVTRPTGAMVRKAIEEALFGAVEPNVIVMDFSHVTLLDFSCADEIVGKLLDAYQNDMDARQTYFLIRGVHDAHLEAIEAVLERYGLAVVVEDTTGAYRVVGTLDDGARRVWHFVVQRGEVVVQQVETELGETFERCVRAIDELSTRRLLERHANGFVTLPHAS
jgi:hypothetical protein